MKILIADDEKLVRIGLESMLDELLPGRAEYLHAANAFQAMALLEERGAPELAFVDHKMPRMTGLELIESCAGQYTGTRWMLMSGYDMAQYSPRIARCGIECVLPKPVSTEELAALLISFGIEVNAQW